MGEGHEASRFHYISRLYGGNLADCSTGATACDTVIRILSSQSPGAFADLLRGFHQGLKETGYIAGENVAIEYAWADNQIDRLSVLAAELVRRQVSVIVASGLPASEAAIKATTTISIVFTVPADPVKLGFVASLARTTGDAPGIHFFVAELAAKRLEILRELMPGAARVAVLINPAEAAIAAANLLGVESWLPKPWDCKSRFSTPVRLAKSTRPLQLLWGSGSTPFSLAVASFSSPSVFNWQP